MFTGLLVLLMAVPVFAQPSLGTLTRPLYISHRGDMNLFPEETLEAYRASLDDGAQFVEVDCYKLSDGTLAVVHDDTLERVTNRTGAVTSIANLSDWRQVRVLGDKLVPPQAGKTYQAPVLDDIINEFGSRAILVVEAKNVGAGDLIVSALKKANIPASRVLVNSFIASELQPAKQAGYPTCLDMGGSATDRVPDNFPYDYLSLSDSAPDALVRQAIDARIKVIIFTLNRQYQRDKFLAMGVEGFYSDDAPYLGGSVNARVRSGSDPFAKQTWFHGQLPTTPGKLGRFVAPNKWGFGESASGSYYGCLQGWCSPLNQGNASADFSLELDITFGDALSSDRWAGIFLAGTDHPLDNDSAPAFALFGYHFLAAKDGRLLVYRYEGGGPVLHASASTGRAIATGETIHCILARTGGNVTFSRRGADPSVTFAGGNLQALYVTLGAKGLNADFSNVQVTSAAVATPAPAVTTPVTTVSTGGGGKGGGGGAPSFFMLGALLLLVGHRALRVFWPRSLTG